MAAMKSKVGLTVESLGGYLREQRVAAGVSLRQLAEQAGVSNPYLSQIERGLRRPSAEVLQQLAKALRISAEQLYVQAGILNPDDGETRSVELAILADPLLGDRHKQALLEVYHAFRSLDIAAGLSNDALLADVELEEQGTELDASGAEFAQAAITPDDAANPDRPVAPEEGR